MVFNVGESFRARLCHSFHTLNIHVVGIVEGMVVIKWYGKHKQWWHYEILHPDEVELAIDRARIIKP